MTASYISAEGLDLLRNLRVGFSGTPVGDRAPIALLARVPSDECGCPEELWRVDGIEYLIHIEPEAGTGEIFALLGDDDVQIAVQANSIEELRAEMFEQHAAICRRGEG